LSTVETARRPPRCPIARSPQIRAGNGEAFLPFVPISRGEAEPVLGPSARFRRRIGGEGVPVSIDLALSMAAKSMPCHQDIDDEDARGTGGWPAMRLRARRYHHMRRRSAAAYAVYAAPESGASTCPTARSRRVRTRS